MVTKCGHTTQNVLCKSNHKRNTFTPTGCSAHTFPSSYYTENQCEDQGNITISPSCQHLKPFSGVVKEEKGHDLQVTSIITRCYCNRRYLNSRCGYIWCRIMCVLLTRLFFISQNES